MLWPEVDLAICNPIPHLNNSYRRIDYFEHSLIRLWVATVNSLLICQFEELNSEFVAIRVFDMYKATGRRALQVFLIAVSGPEVFFHCHTWFTAGSHGL